MILFADVNASSVEAYSSLSALSTTESVEKRKQILESEFNIPMTKEIEEEVLEMCNLGMAIELTGVEKGKELSLLESIKKMMKNAII